MKYRFSLLALMAVMAAPLAAQGGGGGGGGGRGGGRAGGGQRGGGADMNYDALNTIYSFTADQKPKVEAAIAKRDSVTVPMNTFRMALQAQAAAGGATAAGGGRGGPQLPPDSTTKLNNARTAFTAALKAIMTPAQSTKFDSVTAAGAARGGRGGRGGGGGGGGGGI